MTELNLLEVGKRIKMARTAKEMNQTELPLRLFGFYALLF